MHDKAYAGNRQTCRSSANTRGNQHSAAGTQRNHNEYDFKPFEKYCLEGREGCDPIEPRLVAAGPSADICRLFSVRRPLIPERGGASRPAGRPSAPEHARKQEEKPPPETTARQPEQRENTP